MRIVFVRLLIDYARSDFPPPLLLLLYAWPDLTATSGNHDRDVKSPGGMALRELFNRSHIEICGDRTRKGSFTSLSGGAITKQGNFEGVLHLLKKHDFSKETQNI